MVFMASLRKGDFLFTLSKEAPETMSELMYTTQKFMNKEDALNAKDDDPPIKKRKETDDRWFEQSKPKVPKFSDAPKKKKHITLVGQFKSFTPLNTLIDQMLMQIQDNPALRWLDRIRSELDGGAKNLYYCFHRDHGHLIDDCLALKEQIEALIHQGKVQCFVGRKKADGCPPRTLQPKNQAENSHRGLIGKIRKIIRGLASGRTPRSS